MIKFTYQFEDKSPLVEMTLYSESTLGEVLENFEQFLKASGYSFTGTVDIIDQSEVN